VKILRNPTKIQRKERIRKMIFRLILFITVVLLMLGIILKSDYFKIDTIEVVGNKNLSKADIIDSSKISKKENIFKISKKIVKEEVEELPFVKEAKIKRKLPRTVIIDVIEREEKLLIKNISTYLVIDKEGYILKQVETNDENLPVLLGVKIDNIKLGENIFLNLKDDALIDLIEEGDKIFLLNSIKEMDLELLDDIKIKLNNGIDIVFGNLDNVKYKLNLLNEILEHITENEIKCSKIIMNKGSHPIIVTDD